MCEFDLAVICDLVGGVGELVHYLERRLAVEELDVETNDELDWFGRYLSQGLTFGHDMGTSAHLLSQTTSFDDYYMPAPERRSASIRPRLQVSPETQARLAALESAGMPGFVGAVGALLDRALPRLKPHRPNRSRRRNRH